MVVFEEVPKPPKALRGALRAVGVAVSVAGVAIAYAASVEFCCHLRS
jgi:hypothetical protein